MKAYLIDPEQKSIATIDLGGTAELPELIGYDTIESDAIGDEGDRLYFDEECFLRGSSGRFQIDTVVPVSGKAVLVGSRDGGATLQDVRVDLEALEARLRYL